MENITSILSDYELREKRRALGGIYALAGFDYQLRLYLAEFAESLAGQEASLNDAGSVFLEALSDLAKHDVNDNLICIQVKRTLTKETLKDAAAEILTIEQFLATYYSDLRAQVKFNLIASQGNSTIQWNDIPSTHPARSTINELLKQGRLLSPRIEPDPWWRAIVAVWRHLKDPYAFLRFALDRALSRAPTAADAQRIRDDICEYFAKNRLTHELPGQLLTATDFRLSQHPSPYLEVGREITLTRMRDQQYMPRAYRLDAVYARVLERKDLSQRDLKSEARVFWLSGRSGVGKSVLLLQSVERLVAEGWRVLWLKGQAELLEPVLRAIADAPNEWRPDFIAIDDLYDRNARNRLDLSRLGAFIDECDQQAWPMILTCGPTEFAESFREAATYRGFDLHLETVETIATHEAAEIEAWYRERTGQTVQRGIAFSQATQEDNGLFISLAVELAHGDLKAFAQRFGERVRLNGLDEALYFPLALNRLYLRAPYNWLTENDREKLATLNSEGDFSLLEAGEEGQIVRLTHPHLANELYLALRKPANDLAYTNDLIGVFRRALAEGDFGLVTQLLRLFSGREQGLAIERLNILNPPLLAKQCAQAWAEKQTQLTLDADNLADIATSWACWSTAVPSIGQTLGTDLLAKALTYLAAAYKAWSVCWGHLVDHYPKHSELLTWAAEHLTDALRISHPTWSYVWERCLQDDPARHNIWRNIGLDWLQRRLRRPDWHIVWKKLLPTDGEPDWNNDPALILARRRLHTENDGPDWAFVLQDLYALATPQSPQATELASLARAWLAGREDRAEWAYVWRALLEQRNAQSEGQGFIELLRLGVDWLKGREDKAEWAHVWRAALEQRDVYPEELKLSELLRVGVEWLKGREDRAEWSYVWQALLEQADTQHEGLEFNELLLLGINWLKGREDRAQWSYIWQNLLKKFDAQPEALEFNQLLTLGVDWLKGREDKAEWAHVWQALLEQRDVLPKVLQHNKLLLLGVHWLKGREDRAEWSYVWQALLEQADTQHEGLEFNELLLLGINWLKGREDRAQWSYIWQDLLKKFDAQPEALEFNQLLTLGVDWLKGREDRAEWNYVWRNLLELRDIQPEGLELSELFNLGAAWLITQEGSEEWGFVCETLLDQRFRAADFLELAANWLNNSREKPEWPLLAAKFILAAPLHNLSAEFAAILSERVKACPNNAHWFKTVSLVTDLMVIPELPSEIVNWLQVLHGRKELPAWVEARRCLSEGLPVKGWVTAPKGKNSYVVELEIGLLALYSDTRDTSLITKGKIYNFFVQQMNVERDFVLVGLDKNASLDIGKSYEGNVISILSYGLFVVIDGQQGLLHQSHCTDWGSITREFPVGSTICVEVLALHEKGPVLRYAGSELKPDTGASELKVGDTYNAYITGIQKYGIFLRVGDHSGLLHRSTLPTNVDILRKYKVGQQLIVQVMQILQDGKITFALPINQKKDQ